jgi:hypothetical protein
MKASVARLDSRKIEQIASIANKYICKLLCVIFAWNTGDCSGAETNYLNIQIRCKISKLGCGKKGERDVEDFDFQ